MKLILHGWYNEYTFWSKSKYSPKMPKMFEKSDNLAIIQGFFVSSYNSDLKARKTTVTFWRVRSIYIIHLFALWHFFFSQIWSPTQKNFTLFKVFTRASWQSLLWFVQSCCRVTNSGHYLKINQTKLENTLTILTFLNKNKVSIKKNWQNNFHGTFDFWMIFD